MSRLIFLFFLVLAKQASGQATSAAAQVTGQAQLQASVNEAAVAAAKGDKNTETLLHGQKQSTNMLRSMLMANSQQMFAINNLQKEVARMRKRLDRHEEQVFKCKKKLDEYESAQKQLATDAALADSIEPPIDAFLQVDEHLELLKKQTATANAQLQTLLLGNRNAATNSREESESDHSGFLSPLQQH